MMKNFLLILIVLQGFEIFAQGTITVKNGSLSSNSNYSNKVSYYNVKDGDVIILNHETIGSPYLYDEFQLGSIYLEDKEIISSIPLKYNVYNDVFLAKPDFNTPDNESQGITKSENLKIKLGNRYFIALPNINNRYELQYYEILNEGSKVSLLKKMDKIYKERIAATTSLTRDSPASFKDRVTYFILESNKDVKEVPSSKKKLLEFFGDFKKPMADYIKENKLNANDEKDLIRIITHYNTL